MADQYGLIPDDYADDLKYLSNTRYVQGIPISILEAMAEGFLSH